MYLADDYTGIRVRTKQDLGSPGFQTNGLFTILHYLIMTEVRNNLIFSVQVKQGRRQTSNKTKER